MTEPELLVAGDDRPPRRWPWLAALAVVLLLAAGSWLDGVVRAAELDGLADQVARAQRTLDQGDAHVAGMLAYGQPLLSRAGLEPTLRSDLQDLVREAHGEAATGTAAARAELAGLRVLPWHTDVAAAVTAYDDYLAARERTSTAASTDVEVGFAQHPEHRATLAAARAAAVAAAGVGSDLAGRFEQLLVADASAG